MRTLKSLLEKKVIKPKKNLDEKTIFFLWQKIIEREYGKQGVKNIKFSFYKNKTLYIAIKNSNWRNEIWMKKSFLCEELNKKIGQPEVKKIVVKNN